MEKKWWYIGVVQTQLLILLLVITQPTFAKSVTTPSSKKEKTNTTGKITPQSAKKSATRSAPAGQASSRRPAGAAAKSLQKQKSASSRKLTTKSSTRKAEKRTAPVLVSTKKGKKAFTTQVQPKAWRATQSRTRSRFAVVPSRSKQRSALASSRQSSTSRRLAKAETHRVLLENNADTTELLTPYSPELAPFPAQLNAERLTYRINSAFVLPGETLTLNVTGSRKKNEFLLQTALSTTQVGPNSWSWKAPLAAGVYPVRVSHASWGASIQLNVIVMVPFEQLEAGEINGYHIGAYPTIPTRQLSTYTLPRGFIEVTADNEQTFVSPHFRLRQFLCKQTGDYPKYMVLDSRLLIVLETILKRVNEKGLHTPTLSIMSGYRTPSYNRAIGNATTYSRHVWGDAADIFIDVHPRDGEMDDLNDDGDINIHDTQVLYDVVFDLYEPRVQRFLAGSFFNEPILQQLIANGYSDDQRLQRLMTGGLARYRETGSHGPFVHVDVRGIFTRWGR